MPPEPGNTEGQVHCSPNPVSTAGRAQCRPNPLTQRGGSIAAKPSNTAGQAQCRLNLVSLQGVGPTPPEPRNCSRVGPCLIGSLARNESSRLSFGPNLRILCPFPFRSLETSRPDSSSWVLVTDKSHIWAPRAPSTVGARSRVSWSEAVSCTAPLSHRRD